MITMSNTFSVSSITFRQLWLLGSAVTEKVWCTLSLRLSNTSRIQWWVCTMSRGMKRSYASIWSCQKRLSVTLVPFRIEPQVLHNALSLPSMSIADIPTLVLAKWDTGLPLMIVLTVLGLALVFSYLLCPRTVRYHYLSQEPARLPWWPVWEDCIWILEQLLVLTILLPTLSLLTLGLSLALSSPMSVFSNLLDMPPITISHILEHHNQVLELGNQMQAIMHPVSINILLSKRLAVTNANPLIVYSSAVMKPIPLLLTNQPLCPCTIA